MLPLRLSVVFARFLPSLFLLAAAAPAYAETASAAVVDPLSIVSPDPGYEIHYAPDRLVVRLAPAASRDARLARLASASLARAGRTGIASLDRIAEAVGGRFEPGFAPDRQPEAGDRFPDLSEFWIARFSGEEVTSFALEALRALPEVASVERSAIVPVTGVANDSLWNKAWYFFQTNRRDIHAPEAWDLSVADPSQLIAIIDTGCLLYHPDLGGTIPGGHGKFFVNELEAAGTANQDDDHNGYVDDVTGWDFVALANEGNSLLGEDWRDEDNDPNDFAFHGTAVAGITAAATFNTTGVAGTAPGARILPLRVGWASTASATGEVDLSFAAKAVQYATNMGATVINISFATTNQQNLSAAVDYALAQGVIVVSASGNNGTPHYIADKENVIAVAASDNLDKVTLFSNRGAYVDLCAPGYLIATTSLQIPRTGPDSISLRQPGYSIGATGTSFAAPITSGVAALVQSRRAALGLPPYSPEFMRLRILETCDDISALNPSITLYGAGRINAARALGDPPTSYALPIGSRTVGAPLALTTYLGETRIACVTQSGDYLLLDAQSGGTIVQSQLPAAPSGGLAMADLGGGIGRGLFVGLVDGRIAGLTPGGDVLPGWPVAATTVSQLPGATPALGDLDGDGTVEVVWGGDDGRVHAWSARGERRPGFPRVVGGAARNVLVALSDLDGAPGVEIAASTANGSLHVIKGDGLQLAGFPVAAGLQPGGPIVISSRADTTSPLIVVASTFEIRGYERTGASAWIRATDGYPIGPLAAGNLVSDLRDEIVSPNADGSQLGLSLLRPDGTKIVTKRYTGVLGPPVVGPLAKTGANAVGIFLSNAGTDGFSVLDAALNAVKGFVPKIGAPGTDPSLAELDGDDNTEILAGSGDGQRMWVYDAGLDTRGATLGPWPIPGANAARTSSRLYAPPETPLDAAPPEAIADLRARAVSYFSATLEWSTPQDNGPEGKPARYEMRIAPFPLDPSNFALGAAVPLPLPLAAGALETTFIPGLAEDRRYWVAMRSRDAAGNWSPISNVSEIAVGHAFPSAVNDLRVSASGDSSLTVVWTATGDNGRIGRPKRYLVRVSPEPIVNAAFPGLALGVDVDATVDAGGEEHATVTGLDPSKRWWVALRAEDANGNESLISNIASSLLGRFGRTSGAVLAARRTPSPVPVELAWQGDDSPGTASVMRVMDVTGRVIARVPLSGSGGIALWSGASERGNRVPAGVYFAELRSGAFTARTRFVLLR